MNRTLEDCKILFVLLNINYLKNTSAWTKFDFFRSSNLSKGVGKLYLAFTNMLV